MDSKDNELARQLSKLDGLLEHVEEQPQETTVPRPTPSENFAEHTINTQKEEQIPPMNDIPQPVNTQPVNNNVLSGVCTGRNISHHSKYCTHR